MPTYVYYCSTCEKHREVQQPIKDPKIEICPHCGNPWHRVIQPVGISFKGSGFYSNDYGTGSSYKDYVT